MYHENENDLVSKVERDLRQINDLISRNPSAKENEPLTQLQLRRLSAADTTNSDVRDELVNFEKLFALYGKLRDDANDKLRELKVMVKEGKEVYEKTGKLLDSLNHDKKNASPGSKSEILDGVTCYNIDNHLRSSEMKMQRAVNSTECVKSLHESLVRYQKIFKLTKSELDILGSRHPVKETEVGGGGDSKKSISFRRFVRDATTLDPSDSERDSKITKLMSEIDIFMGEHRKLTEYSEILEKETKDAE